MRGLKKQNSSLSYNAAKNRKNSLRESVLNDMKDEEMERSMNAAHRFDYFWDGVNSMVSFLHNSKLEDNRRKSEGGDVTGDHNSDHNEVSDFKEIECNLKMA